MTRVRRPTSGFKTMATARIQQTLTDQHREKERLDTCPSPRLGKKLPSDGAAAGALLAGARHHDQTLCQPYHIDRRDRA